MDSSLMAEPEDKMGEGQDKIVKEDDINQDSYGSSKSWYTVWLSSCYQRSEQVALLLDVLKCDKSVVPSIYQFCTQITFEARLTYAESEKFEDLLGVVEDVSRRIRRTWSRTFKGRPKTKKQKISTGSILSQQRENKEKWRYNEDLEADSEIEESEDEEYFSDDDAYRVEAYHKFDASGRRPYQVCLIDEITKKDQKALLRNVLKRDPSEPDCIYGYKADHLFQAHMNEKEADKIAGLEKVEYVEPCSFIFGPE